MGWRGGVEVEVRVITRWIRRGGERGEWELGGLLG
jgi:hypothetical protein